MGPTSHLTRRTFLSGAASLAACALPLRTSGAADRPNSVFGGVRIGCNTYSYRGEISSAEDTLKALVADGLSEVELKETPIYAYTGMAPEVRGKAAPTGDQRQALLAKCSELRRMYNDAGVTIHP